MTRSTTGGGDVFPVRLAVIALALAVALLSSLMSSGLPRTTALGSAFNPATTAVALKPTRAQPRVMLEPDRRDDAPAGGQGMPIGLAAALVATVRHATAEPMVAVAARPETPLSPVAGLNGSPRGPPLA